MINAIESSHYFCHWA